MNLDSLNWGLLHLHEESCAVIAMENPSNRNGARHRDIDTREHLVHQLVKDHIVKLVHFRTSRMVADALTKYLPAPAFEQHRATVLGEDEAPFSAMMCRVSRNGNPLEDGRGAVRLMRRVDWTC